MFVIACLYEASSWEAKDDGMLLYNASRFLGVAPSPSRTSSLSPLLSCVLEERSPKPEGFKSNRSQMLQAGSNCMGPTRSGLEH